MAKTNTPKQTASDHNHDDHTGHDHDHAGHDHGTQGPRHPEIGDSKQIEFTITWDIVNKAYQGVLKKYQPLVKTDGFRKGHAPVKLVEQMVGMDRLLQETAEKVLPPAYVEAVKKADAKPISDPEIHPTSMEMGKDWAFHAHIAEKPEVKLGKYEEVAAKAAKQFEADAKKAPSAHLAGSSDSPDNLRDDKSDLKTVSDLSKAKTDEEKAVLKEADDQERKDHKLNAILAALRESIKPIIPELLIRQEAQQQLDQLGQQMKTYNIELDSYLKSMGKTEADIQQEYVGRALASWQLEVILDAIATDQKLDATETEIEEMITKSYPAPHHSGSPDSPEILRDDKADVKTVSASSNVTATQKAQVKAMMRKQKVFEFLLGM